MLERGRQEQEYGIPVQGGGKGHTQPVQGPLAEDQQLLGKPVEGSKSHNNIKKSKVGQPYLVKFKKF